MVSSLIANVLLLVAKIVAFILSQSKSVLASAADSFVDIASQVTPHAAIRPSCNPVMLLLSRAQISGYLEDVPCDYNSRNGAWTMSAHDHADNQRAKKALRCRHE